MELKQAEYRTILSAGGRGVFAKVILSATLCKDYCYQITFDQEEGKEWLLGVRFGIEYAWRQIVFKKTPEGTKGLIVRIDQILGTTVDSTQLAMAFAASMALWTALNIYPDRLPSLDMTTRIFHFPD
jgi:hypothetical protein